MKKQNKKTLKISVIVPANTKFLSKIRNFTFNFIKNMTDLDEKWTHRFQTLVDELCTNAIEHGSASDKDIKLTLLHKPKKSFEVIVEDTGTGKIQKKAAELKKIAKKEMNQLVLRGRGLSKIVKNWTDEMNFSDRREGGIKIHVKKNFPPTS